MKEKNSLINVVTTSLHHVVTSLHFD